MLKNVANILAQAAENGTKILADPWLCTAAYESIGVVLFCINQEKGVEIGAEISANLQAEAIPLIQSTLKVLRLMKPLFVVAEHCVSILLQSYFHI